MIDQIMRDDRLERTLGRLEEKIDGIANTLQSHLDGIKSNEKRVNSLERTRDRQWGGAKVLGVVLSVFAAIAGWFGFN